MSVSNITLSSNNRTSERKKVQVSNFNLDDCCWSSKGKEQLILWTDDLLSQKSERFLWMDIYFETCPLRWVKFGDTSFVQDEKSKGSSKVKIVVMDSVISFHLTFSRLLFFRLNSDSDSDALYSDITYQNKTKQWQECLLHPTWMSFHWISLTHS